MQLRPEIQTLTRLGVPCVLYLEPKSIHSNRRKMMDRVKICTARIDSLAHFKELSSYSIGEPYMGKMC